MLGTVMEVRYIAKPTIARESAVENTEAAAVHGDHVARTKAVVKGKVLRGTVRASQALRVGLQR